MKDHKRVLISAVIFGLILCVFLPFAYAEEDQVLDLAMKNLEPKDKLITQKEEITVKKVEGGNVSTSTAALENVGKNSVIIDLRLDDGRAVKVLRRVIRLPLFEDVPSNHFAKKQIELSVAAGLIDKGGSVYFRPEGSIARDNFAKMIARALNVKPAEPKAGPASDVPVVNKNAKYVFYALKTRGLMDIDSDGSFRPADKVTKGEAIAAFLRLDGIEQDWNMHESPFDDLSGRHKYAKYISAAKAAGWLKYAEEAGVIDADGPLTNAEFAYLVSKTKVGKKSIERLLNWEVGYSK
jgi:hypothetical protein